MDKDIRKILQEKNYVLSNEEYISLFNPIEDESISNVKYLDYCNKFQVSKGNEFFEFKVEPKVKIKKN